MKIKTIVIFSISIFVCFAIFTKTSCNKCNQSPAITSFVFNDLSPAAVGEISNYNKTITVEVPASTDLTSLVPTISPSEPCFNLSPMSGVAQDFTNTVTYSVSNEVGDENIYSVEVKFPLPPKMQINWTEDVTQLPEARAWMPTVELNNKVYVIGGLDMNVNATNKMIVYDPATNTWDDTKATMSIPRNGHTANVVDGKIYVIGGFESAQGNAVNHMEAYDPITDTWETLSILPQKTGAHSSAVVNGKIYIMGGEPSEPPGGITYDNTFMYDPQTDSWTELAPMPEARCWFTASAANGKVYTFGGVNNSTKLITNEIYEYDPVTDTWQEMVSMKMDRMVAGACTINDHIFIAAGTPTVLSPGLAVVEVFDPSENTITTGTSISKPRLAAGVCSIDGKVIVLGGSIVGAPWEVMTDLVELGEPVW